MDAIIRIREVKASNPIAYVCTECMFYQRPSGCRAPDDVPVCSENNVYQFVSLSNVKVQLER